MYSFCERVFSYVSKEQMQAIRAMAHLIGWDLQVPTSKEKIKTDKKFIVLKIFVNLKKTIKCKN